MNELIGQVSHFSHSLIGKNCYYKRPDAQNPTGARIVATWLNNDDITVVVVSDNGKFYKAKLEELTSWTNSWEF